MIFVGGAPSAFAVSWFDNFDDMNATDGSPVTWSFNSPTALGEVFPGTYDVSSGDLFLKGDNLQSAIGLFDDDDEVLVGSVESQTFTDTAAIGDGVSVRLRALITPYAGIGLLGMNTSLTLQTYYGVHHVNGESDPNDPNLPISDGEIELSIFDGAEIELADLNLLPPIEDPEEVVAQLDVIDGVVEFTYWKVGDPQSTAQTSGTFADTTFSSGVAGFVFNEDEFMGDIETGGTATVRWIKASSGKILDGDLNNDGSVNFGDLTPFVTALTDPAGYETMFGQLPVINGDVNHDGAVNFGDLSPFVDLLTAEAAAAPEPGGLVLAGMAAMLLAWWGEGTRRKDSGIAKP
jgi:hypothetical protein